MTKPAVELRGVSFAYPRQGHRLDDIYLSIQAAELCTLLGPNGAGKTTLLRCLLGLLMPERGTVCIQGRNTAHLPPRQMARLAAYVPQDISIPFPFTALEIVVMGRTCHLPPLSAPSAADRRLARDQMERLAIGHLANRMFSKLSGGERQLVVLARALLQDTPILVLDEPAAALDYGNEVRLLQTLIGLARDGRTVLMTTHQPAQALAHADRAVLMRAGRIVADGPASSIVTAERLGSLYGVSIHVAAVPIPGEPGREVLTCVPLPSRTTRPRG